MRNAAFFASPIESLVVCAITPRTPCVHRVKRRSRSHDNVSKWELRVNTISANRLFHSSPLAVFLWLLLSPLSVPLKLSHKGLKANDQYPYHLEKIHWFQLQLLSQYY